MQIIPAIDLKDNKCVRLSKGKDLSSVVYNEDPEKQAIYFEQIGCKKLHLIDLDAAFGRSNVNFETIKKIRKSISIPIQLGGGVRSLDLAKKYFEVGINNLIIGSMSVEKPNEVITLSNIYADKVYISLDILEDNIMIKGWDKNSGKKTQDILLENNYYIDEEGIITIKDKKNFIQKLYGDKINNKELKDSINNANANMCYYFITTYCNYKQNSVEIKKKLRGLYPNPENIHWNYFHSSDSIDDAYKEIDILKSNQLEFNGIGTYYNQKKI